MKRYALLPLVACASLACADTPLPNHGGQAASVRDSAGVHVVEHAGIPDDLPMWSASGAPSLRIGAVEGVTPDVFGSVGVVAESSSGDIVVADVQAQELRVFAPNGAHRWTTGGDGDGPGEFRWITAAAFIRGDSVVAFDRRHQRVTVVGPDGSLGREYSVAAPDEGTRPNDGGFIGSVGRFVGAGSLTQLPRGPGRTVYQGAMQLLFYGPDGSLVHTGAPVRSGEYVMDRDGRGYRSWGLTFSPFTQLVVGAEHVVLTTQERFELQRYDADGGLVDVFRVSTPAVPVDRAAYDATFASGASPLGDLVPDSLPAVDRLVVGSDGRIWVEEYVPYYSVRVADWWVLEPDGEFVARVGLPAGFSLRVAGRDHVVGVSRDDLGVAYVERYEIVE